MAKPISELASFYQERFGYTAVNPDLLPLAPQLKLIIVIPAFHEFPEETFRSLGENDIDGDQVEILLVINHSENAPATIKEFHKKQTDELRRKVLQNGIKVHVITAFDLPKKHAGVGFARKIGMDLALARFGAINYDGMLVCLDADCTVSSGYLQALLKSETEKVNGLSIYFEHPLERVESPEIRQRIISYEIWLRYYINALRWAGYPHSFHTIGSSMAARASAYAKVGGMNRKKAGEDFYFLHKLIPQGRFYDLTEATVFPSARISERVPFGTGRAMLEMQAGTKGFDQLYHPEIFTLLRKFLQTGETIFAEKESWPPLINEAFEEFGWHPVLEALHGRSSNPQQALTNFNHWFDGFKVLKLVHYLRDEHFGTLPTITAVNTLFPEAGKNNEEILLSLRNMDKRSALKLSL